MLKIARFEKQKKKQYQTYARAIKQKAEALNAKVKELKLKEQNIKHMVPVQEYNKMKMHLTVLNRKHQTFRNMIVNSNGSLDQSQMQLLQMQLQAQPAFSMSNFNPVVGSYNQSGSDMMTNNRQQSQLFEQHNNLLVSEANMGHSNNNESNDNFMRSLSPIKNEMVSLTIFFAVER